MYPVVFIIEDTLPVVITRRSVKFKPDPVQSRYLAYHPMQA